MFANIDVGAILAIAANATIIIGGLYGLWRFAKRQWQILLSRDQSR